MESPTKSHNEDLKILEESRRGSLFEIVLDGESQSVSSRQS